MVFKYIFVLPIFLTIWIIITLAACYTLAVLNKHVEPIFPYVSDTGAWQPESSVFTFMVVTGAFFLTVAFYVRYLQVKNYLSLSSANLEKINNISFVSGLGAVIGLIAAASFQETSILFVHLAGAGAAFGLGTFYQILQTYVSMKLYPTIGNGFVNFLRLIFALFSLVTSLVSAVFFVLAYLQFKGDNVTIWKIGDPGYENHLIGAIAEWILVISTVFYIASLTGEFYEFHLVEPKIMGKLEIHEPRAVFS